MNKKERTLNRSRMFNNLKENGRKQNNMRHAKLEKLLIANIFHYFVSKVIY